LSASGGYFQPFFSQIQTLSTGLLLQTILKKLYHKTAVNAQSGSYILLKDRNVTTKISGVIYRICCIEWLDCSLFDFHKRTIKVPKVTRNSPNILVLFINRMQFSLVAGILKRWSQYHGQYCSLSFSYAISAHLPQITMEKSPAVMSQKTIGKIFSICILSI
jgi:hypothetical protein